MKAVTARISGRVQGVGFRYTARSRAERLGVCGWVRNNPDGTVEVLAEGEDGAVDSFLDWLNRGPSGAYVKHVDVSVQPYSGSYSDFRIQI